MVIDHLLVTMTEKRIAAGWGNLETGTSQHHCLQTSIVKDLDISEYNPEGVKGKIHTLREVGILPFGTTVVKGIVLTIYSKYLNVIVNPVRGYLENIAMVRYYRVLKPGRGTFDVCLRNHSTKKITIPKWTAVGEIAAANIIPALLALKPTAYSMQYVLGS